jgi:hypothetical protein
MTGGFGAALTLGQMLDQAAAALDASQEAVVFKEFKQKAYATRGTTSRSQRSCLACA